MPGRFNPAPDDRITLKGGRYVFLPHPQVTYEAYGATASRATVYKLRGDTPAGSEFALKVFKKVYRQPSLLQAANRLKKYEPLAGLTAARRVVIEPSDGAAREHPDLTYAMLMPWIQGSTWLDLLLQAAGESANGRAVFGRDQALLLCDRFLHVMNGLEASGITHTDIAAGNVMLDLKANDVQLLDLEDMHSFDDVAPAVRLSGQSGYIHPAASSGPSSRGFTTWCPEGDRYATAILASEILILSEPSLARHASDTGDFGGNRTSPQAAQRYVEALRFLRSISPELADLFERAWTSDELVDCPTAGQLKEGIARPVSMLRATKRSFPQGAGADPPPDGVIWANRGAAPAPSRDGVGWQTPERDVVASNGAGVAWRKGKQGAPSSWTTWVARSAAAAVVVLAMYASFQRFCSPTPMHEASESPGTAVSERSAVPPARSATPAATPVPTPRATPAPTPAPTPARAYPPARPVTPGLAKVPPRVEPPQKTGREAPKTDAAGEVATPPMTDAPSKNELTPGQPTGPAVSPPVSEPRRASEPAGEPPQPVQPAHPNEPQRAAEPPRYAEPPRSAEQSPPARPTPPSPAPPSVPAPYNGPTMGTLTYSGPPIVQNAEVVFRNLPMGRLLLTYDQGIWEAILSPEGNTQRLILRNKRPGTQKKCVVNWRLAQ